MIKYAFNNIRARKARSLLCVLVVMASIFLVSTVNGMLSNMEASLDDELSRYAGKIYLATPGSTFPPYNSLIEESTAVAALDTAKISENESTPVLYGIVVKTTNPRSLGDVVALGISPGKEASLWGTEVKVLEGNQGPVKEGSVILSREAADHYKVHAGDNLELMGRRFKVGGIVDYKVSYSTFGVVVIPLGEAQAVFDKEGGVSAALMTTDSIDDVRTVSKSLASRFPRLEVVTQDEMLESAEKSLETPRQFMGLIRYTLLVVTLVILLMIMVMAVIERTREIGIIRALGAGRRFVLLTIFFEALTLGLFGGIAGIVFSVPMAFVLGFSRAVSAGSLAQVFVLVVIITSVASIYPAYRALKVTPIEGLRYE